MRALNFNAGPAGLPLAALERAQKEFLDFEGSGMSILEHSHRGKAYEAVHNEAKKLLIDLLDIPASHDVLFLQGGASQQFALIPMNFLPAEKSADYVLTGMWSEKARDEAALVGKTRIALSTIGTNSRYTRVPRPEEIKPAADAAYVHITSNNTIFGTQYSEFPTTGAVPLVADMSSDFLSRPIDVSRFHLIYAGAQKNLGPSGLAVVILKKEWAQNGRSDIPAILRYTTHMQSNSLYNTPPTFAIYLMRNVLAWITEQGGLAGMARRNQRKGDLLYGALDRMADFYRAPVEKDSRSLMNVVFRLPTEELEDLFVAEAEKLCMVGLKGHRSVGGIRVSTYNAVSELDIKALVGFMSEFAHVHGRARPNKV